MKWLSITLLLSCLAVTACVSQTALVEDFDRSVKAFNRLLRWREIESAGMTYVDPKLREDFLKQAESLKKRGLAVTDFRILTTKYYPEKRSGDVIAEFDYYMLPSNKVKTVSYRQEWSYGEDGKNWIVKSSLPVFE